jgi:hypothetical protein
LFPNPVNEQLQIKVEEDVEVCIYTLNGSLIIRQQVKEKTGIHVGHLINGMYMVKLTGKSGSAVQRLIVQH